MHPPRSRIRLTPEHSHDLRNTRALEASLVYVMCRHKDAGASLDPHKRSRRSFSNPSEHNELRRGFPCVARIVLNSTFRAGLWSTRVFNYDSVCFNFRWWKIFHSRESVNHWNSLAEWVVRGIRRHLSDYVIYGNISLRAAFTDDQILQLRPTIYTENQCFFGIDLIPKRFWK